jgi:hypothetical protein
VSTLGNGAIPFQSSPLRPEDRFMFTGQFEMEQVAFPEPGARSEKRGAFVPNLNLNLNLPMNRSSKRGENKRLVLLLDSPEEEGRARGGIQPCGFLSLVVVFVCQAEMHALGARGWAVGDDTPYLNASVHGPPERGFVRRGGSP